MCFFRDLCSRTLTPEGIARLGDNIPMIICNLEKIFPPSFFDVMEHLPIHLPREAALRGPVQYRWMYHFERYMFHLKRKVKNLSKVEGSIVAQSLNEYPAYAPQLFTQVGRVSGKGKNRKLSEQKYAHLHMYILTNCEDIMQYESIYMELVRTAYSDYTEKNIEDLKEKDFAPWLQYYVTESITNGATFDTWLVEMVNGLNYIATSYPRYCTRGYAFWVHDDGRTRQTSDYGISATSGDVVYYEIFKEILEVRYPRMLNLRCIVFMCDWYDPFGGGVQLDQFGVTSVHSRRKLQRYDSFILASQADQVYFIRYPRVTYRADPWITVTTINPRGRIYGVSEQDHLQPTSSVPMGTIEPTTDVELVVDFTQFGDARVYSDSEEAWGEFDDDTDSIPSDESSSEAD